jgi:hypothetical protein
MTVSVAAPPRRLAARQGVSLSTVYVASGVLWLVTRWLVLVHHGAWPWMNAFVVAAARGIIVGDWNDAIRPQLPAVLGVPLVLLGASEQQVVAALYVVGSMVQFGAFVVLVRALFPERVTEQSLALLLFLVVPFNHSIHHYRDVPVVLASSAIFLLAAHWLVRAQRPLTVRDGLWVGGAMLLGVWSRTEVLTFVGALLLMGALVWRARALPLIGLYAGVGVVVVGALVAINRVEGIDPAEAARYQWHTFLDSTPESWLSPECRAAATENCRERDGLTYFGPAPAEVGVLPMVVAHPGTTLAKTLQSAWDNLWIVLGPNLSTFPGIAPFLIGVLVLAPSARFALRALPAASWMVALAALAETVLPPLSWAPPHPQYHLQVVLLVVVLLVPVLAALARQSRGRLVATGFFVVSAALSVFRYTRYPGY